MKLKNRNALVTGASKGIGRAIALACAKEGANVVITGRVDRELESLQEEINALSVRASLIVADLFQRDGVDKVWSHCEENFDRIDILINNAGIGSSANPKPVVELEETFWEQMHFLNLTVPFLLSKCVLPKMIECQSGRIINISSIAGKIPSLHGASYTSSKAGLLGLTRTLALETVKEGITVNAICPGPVHTQTNDKRILYEAERLGITIKEIEATSTPMGRRLKPSEIAPLAIFLASDDSSGITGQAYIIDGGIHMS